MNHFSVKTIADAHEVLVNRIIWNHDVIQTENGEQTWEEDSTTITIQYPTLPNRIHPNSSFQQARCEEYAKQLIRGVQTNQNASEKFSYTYHERLYFESQFSDVLFRLKQNPNTRRAVLYTWLPAIDNKSEEDPCLQFIQLLIRNGKLNGTVVMRSNDVLTAFGPNAYGFVTLMEFIADLLNVKIGTYEHIITVPHLYPIRDKADLQRWM